MPGRRGTERRKLGGAVNVRLPVDVAGRIAALADAEGITVASWLRRVAVAALGDDVADLVPVRAYTAAWAPQPPHVLEVARLREAIGEATGALTKSAVFVRAAGDVDAHALIGSLLPVFRSHALDLDRLKLALMAPRQK